MGNVDPQGDGFDRTRPGGGYTVSAAGQSTTTDSQGQWTLSVPPNTDAFTVTGESILTGTKYILPVWLDDFPDEFILHTVLKNSVDTLYTEGFAQPYDAASGLLIIDTVLPDEQDPIGIEFTLDRPNGGSYSVRTTGLPTPAKRTANEGVMMFPNTEPGEVNIQATVPSYMSCEGPTRVQVDAETVTSVLWRCVLQR